MRARLPQVFYFRGKRPTGREGLGRHATAKNEATTHTTTTERRAATSEIPTNERKGGTGFAAVVWEMGCDAKPTRPNSTNSTHSTDSTLEATTDHGTLSPTLPKIE